MNDAKKIKYDKRNESDRQMLLRISKKFAILSVLLLMFDQLLDLLSGVIDLLLEIIHIVIEFFEYSIELLLEHVLNANHQESEVMIVNFVILISLFGVYKFCLILPQLYIWSKRRIKAAWLRYKRRETVYWHSLPLDRKIKVSMTYSFGICAILFLITL